MMNFETKLDDDSNKQHLYCEKILVVSRLLGAFMIQY